MGETIKQQKIVIEGGIPNLRGNSNFSTTELSQSSQLRPFGTQYTGNSFGINPQMQGEFDSRQIFSSQIEASGRSDVEMEDEEEKVFGREVREMSEEEDESEIESRVTSQSSEIHNYTI